MDFGKKCPTDRWLPDAAFDEDNPAYDSSVMWFDGTTNEPFATLYHTDDVRYVYVADALGVTNRYLSRRQNAAFFAGLVRTLAEPGATVVFVEASVGNTLDPSLLDTMGGWATASWWQLILLGIVIVYTVGRRFGIADAVPFRQRGTRELVDAVADIYNRSRATHAALGTVLADCDRRVRHALKLSSDAKNSDRDDLLPDSLAKAFYLAEVATKERGPEGSVMRLARNLQAETDAFLGTKRRPLARRGGRR